MQTFDATQIL